MHGVGNNDFANVDLRLCQGASCPGRDNVEEGIDGGVRSNPMLDLSMSKRISILNGWGNSTLSSMDVREFFIVRQMPVTQ